MTTKGKDWTELEGTQRVVVCAANLSKSTGEIVCGARHYDARMREQMGSGTKWRNLLHKVLGCPRIPSKWLGSKQGFIDQFGVWMDRQEAWTVAESAGQIKYGRDYSKGTLYSEDLY